MKKVIQMINGLGYRLPDSLYIRLLHYKHHKEFLNLRNPEKFAQKIQWLKIYGGLEGYSKYADKYEVRKYIEEKIGAEFLIPLIGVWDRFEDIDFDNLADQFVLKATHGCGYNFICTDKSKIDLASLKSIFDQWTKENFYKQEREVQYKNCKPRIICEQYMEDSSGSLTDYKVWCSKGEAKIIQIDTDRFTNHRCNLLDTDWKPLRYVSVATFGGATVLPPKPAKLTELLEIAQKLSAEFPFVRVDLYLVGDKIYFGELTFTPGSGLVKHEPESAEYALGKFIDLKAYSVTKPSPELIPAANS